MNKIEINSFDELVSNISVVNLKTGVVEKLNENEIECMMLNYSTKREFKYIPTGDTIEVVKVVSVNNVAFEEEYYTILKIGEQSFKVEYFCSSHYGVDFDYAKVYEVFPVQQVITVYQQGVK